MNHSSVEQVLKREDPGRFVYAPNYWQWFVHHRNQGLLPPELADVGDQLGMIEHLGLDIFSRNIYCNEQYSAAFYEEASALCHEYGATFWIHACGQQKNNLKLISSLGVDGLEGVAFPPSGDVTLPEAFALSGDRFLITGGISAVQFEQLQSREAVFAYTQELLHSLRDCRHRFMLSASCNTPINARWEQIVWFRDAWREFAE